MEVDTCTRYGRSTKRTCFLSRSLAESVADERDDNRQRRRRLHDRNNCMRGRKIRFHRESPRFSLVAARCPGYDSSRVRREPFRRCVYAIDGPQLSGIPQRLPYTDVCSRLRMRGFSRNPSLRIAAATICGSPRTRSDSRRQGSYNETLVRRRESAAACAERSAR